jgi:hypothetical protein
VILRSDTACQFKTSDGLTDGTRVVVIGVVNDCVSVQAPIRPGYVPMRYLCSGSEPPGRCPSGCLTPPPGCSVKGNIKFGTGEKIYHVPGQAYYDATVLHRGRGPGQRMAA